MYPAITNAVGFSNAINNAFSEIKSDLKVLIDENTSKIPLTYSIIQKENKYSQIYIASKEKLYLPDFGKTECV